MVDICGDANVRTVSTLRNANLDLMILKCADKQLLLILKHVVKRYE